MHRQQIATDFKYIAILAVDVHFGISGNASEYLGRDVRYCHIYRCPCRELPDRKSGLTGPLCHDDIAKHLSVAVCEIEEWTEMAVSAPEEILG